VVTERIQKQTSAENNHKVDWNSLILLLMLIGPATVMALVLVLWPDTRWVAEIPGAATVILGSVAALLLSIVILFRYREKPGVQYISAALLVIGILGGAQSASSAGTSLFVWLHSFAGFSSAFFIAYILNLRKKSSQKQAGKKTGLFLTGVTAGSIIFAVLSAVFANYLPVMVEEERFAALAWIMNAGPVALFLFAGIFLFYRYRRTGNPELFFFTAIVIFLFQSTEVFYFAKMWGLVWWFWLGLRFAVYVFILSYVLKEYIQISNSLSAEINERRKTEAALRKADNDWRNSFNSLKEVMIIIDRDYNITKINNSGSALIGKNEEEVCGKKCFSVIYHRENPCEQCPFKQTLVTRQVTSIDRFDIASGDYFNRKTAPIFDEYGEITQFVYLISNITERVKAEETEKALQKKLNLTSRLASIGEVAAGITHEINNPLTSVVAFAQLLDTMEIPGEMKEAVQVINDGANRIAGIVEKLHTFARRQRPEKEYADINSILSGVIEMRAYELRNNNIEVISDIDEDLPRTMVNIGQMQQVLLNIIINAEQAIKSNQHGGKLFINTAGAEDTIRITIADNGPGIDAENLDKIFDPFFTTKSLDGGTGLGLSISYGIIKEHGGDIFVNSAAGKGATFTIDLPVMAAPEHQDSVHGEEKQVKHTPKGNILVVDDEPHIRRALERVLSQEGHTVETISSAETALKLLKDKKYDLILLDIKMPGMNGIAFYHNMKDIAPGMQKKVVCITGDTISPDNKAFLRETGISYIAKPFGIDVLMERVNEVIGDGANA
jgi:PAS domain S-box-containing protein